MRAHPPSRWPSQLPQRRLEQLAQLDVPGLGVLPLLGPCLPPPLRPMRR